MRRGPLSLAGMILVVAGGTLAPAPAGAQPDAVFLGLAVVDSIGRDARGDLVLTGIRHVSRAAAFPHTENLSIYTRWGGSGEHDIGISVWNMDTDETVCEEEETVRFADGGITSYAHTFINATFPRGGTYDVETTLDGDLAAEYSLFVGADDSYPDTPELVLSVPARSGALDHPDAASVSGIPEGFTFNSFPALTTFALVTLWFSGASGHLQSMEILDPTGVPIATSPPRPIPSHTGKISVVTESFPDVSLTVRGTYTAVLYLDGEDVFEYPLPVRRAAR